MDNWEIWKTGVYLAEADTHFGDKETVEKYNQNYTAPSFVGVLERMKENAEIGLEGWDILKDVAPPVNPTRKIADDLRKKLKAAVLRNVRKGVLIGYGFSVPRRADDEPQKVPDDLWGVYSSFSSDNVLKSDSLKMEKVRVVYVGWLNKVNSEAPKLAGRPTRQDHIVEAFETLADQDLIDFSKPATACHDLVRQWVLKNYPNEENSDKGLGTKAIAKHINSLFRQYKAACL
ncbi:MAG: hypothetical protein V7723_10720 [Sneathiella sp.]|uniref:hypothetical protein n=1 Tax=Sneathiella sp. TaxID=1964365 RepID=UPI003003847D